MAFASGRFSRAVCDRCGQEYKYQDLKKEWNGLFTCPECYEPKHPQLDPPYHPPDPEALQDPRVESNSILKDDSPTGPDDATFNTFAQPMPMTVFLGEPGDSAFLTTRQSTSPADGSNPTDSNSMVPQTPHKKLIVQSKIGIVTINTSVIQSFTVTVAGKTGGGNAFYLDSLEAPLLNLVEGRKYIFNLSDDTVDGHPFYLSTTSNGVHSGGSIYSTGVVYKINGSEVSQSTYDSQYSSATTRALEITVATGAPTLYYYCKLHSAMGNKINTPTESETVTFTITVAGKTGGGNAFYVDGVERSVLFINEGQDYIFNLSDNTVDGHPFYLSTTSGGTHSGGSPYETGVTYKIDGSAVSQSDYDSQYSAATTRALEISVAIGAPTLYYYCRLHSGMGNQINTL